MNEDIISENPESSALPPSQTDSCPHPVSPAPEGNRDLDKRIEAAEKLHRGGQPGNQNASTHGFYSKAVPPELRQKLLEAETVQGLDGEIALLRARISTASEDPSQSTFLLSGISLLSRLLRTREKLAPQDGKRIDQALVHILGEVSPPVRASITRILQKDDDQTASRKTNPNECLENAEKGAF